MSKNTVRKMDEQDAEVKVDPHYDPANQPFIALHRGLVGTTSVMFIREEEGYYTPIQKDVFGYTAEERAIEHGKSWAKAEGLEFRRTYY